MFLRRLFLFLLLMTAAVAVLGAQVSRLTLVHGDALRVEAEQRLLRQSWVPTTRGRILDRHGRVLALDRASYDVAIDYDVISGRWVEEQTGAYARALHADDWGQLDDTQRGQLLARYRPAFAAHVDLAWRRLADAAGVSLDDVLARRDQIIRRVEGMYTHLVRIRTQQARLALERGREISTELDQDTLRRVRQPIVEQSQAHSVVDRVRDNIGFEFMRFEDASTTLVVHPGHTPVEVRLIPGLKVINAGAREYPFESVVVEVDRSTFPAPLAFDEPIRTSVPGLATHMLGWLGAQFREDHDRRQQLISQDDAFNSRVTLERPNGRTVDRGGYLPGDLVGRAGFERTLEPVLRGLRGLEVLHLDSGLSERVEAERGLDVRLTLDVHLQARVHAVMLPEVGLAAVQEWHANEVLAVGTPLDGAAVVLDIDTGDILALVTTPSFVRADLERDEAWNDEPTRLARLNKAVSAQYPPGSIIKAPLLAWGASRGVVKAREAISCTGHLLPDRPDMLRCWIYKQYSMLHDDVLQHPPVGHEAITVSCNIYFYSLGQRLGADRIRQAYTDFGVGRVPGLGLDLESPGLLGRGGRPEAIHPGDEIQMGIGQGPVAWTPLHAANAMATLARSGHHLEPRLVLEESPPAEVDLELHAAAVAEALAGLDGATNDPDHGTGYAIRLGESREPIFNAPGVKVWGKTGTATAPHRIVTNDDGTNVVVRRGDHSWFVILAGPEGGRPRFAIAVIMEYAGSGGRVSGPIANQIVHALIAEGYLHTRAGSGSEGL